MVDEKLTLVRREFRRDVTRIDRGQRLRRVGDARRGIGDPELRARDVVHA